MKTCKKELHQYDENFKYCPFCRKESSKKWRENNVERVTGYYQKEKKWRENNMEYSRNYYQDNKEKMNKYEKKYRQDNKEKIRQKKSERDKKKQKNDIQFRLSKNLRSRLNMAIKRNQKVGSAIRDLGCSVGFLKQYLENQFELGMTWDNYGKGPDTWSIDHIVALSTVDLTNIEQFLRINHYSNLRPLWNKDQMPIYYKEQKFTQKGRI